MAIKVHSSYTIRNSLDTMSTTTLTTSEAVQNAQNALQRGDKLSARRWAELAALLAPEREEPWLLLAAAASPQASVGYLRQALKVNPDSPRAKAGMDWALKRVETAAQTATTARVSVSKPVGRVAQTAATAPLKVEKPAPAPKKNGSLLESAKKSQSSFLFILLPVLLIAVLAFSIWNVSPVLAVFVSQSGVAGNSHAPAWAQAEIAKATMTLTPTAIITPTAPFTSTPVATFSEADTFTPAFTETPIAPMAAEFTPTALPTDSAAPEQATPQPPPNVSPAGPDSGGKWILVDISQQHLWAYQGETLIYSFVASTGMNNATRAGHFAVQSKIPNAYGSTWNIWMPNWLGIYYAGSMENGIHALPILPNGATLWAGFLGTPISYGCVVLGSYEAQLLFDWAEIGTPVTIQW
jgi:lipoprotein-anchoring transpeptidase ErfK/SrfK